jgi:hypothetical protein
MSGVIHVHITELIICKRVMIKWLLRIKWGKACCCICYVWYVVTTELTFKAVNYLKYTEKTRCNLIATIDISVVSSNAISTESGVGQDSSMIFNVI